MAEKAQPLFDKYYEATEEDFKAEAKERTRRALQRKFQSAYDDAGAQVDAMTDKVQAQLQRLSSYNVALVTNSRLEISRLVAAREVMANEYLAMFGEELK